MKQNELGFNDFLTHSCLNKAVEEAISRQWALFSEIIPGDWLQIGGEKCLLPKKDNRCFLISDNMHNSHHIIAEPTALPFKSRHFSMVFLPFLFENKKNIGHILDEAERVLLDDGYLLIAGINPWSIWHLWYSMGLMELKSGNHAQKHKKIKKKLKIHWHSSLGIYWHLSARNVDWQVQGIKSFFYRPPLQSVNTLQKTRFLELIGQVFWPYPGGLYLLLAQKRTLQRLPVAPLWRAGGYVFGKA